MYSYVLSCLITRIVGRIGLHIISQWTACGSNLRKPTRVNYNFIGTSLPLNGPLPLHSSIAHFHFHCTLPSYLPTSLCSSIYAQCPALQWTVTWVFRTSYQSHVPWCTTSPTSPGVLPVPHPLVYYQSHIPWCTTSPTSPGVLPVPHPLVYYQSHIPWCTTSPTSPGVLPVPHPLVYYQSHVPWCTTSPTSPGVLPVPHPLVYYQSHIPWWDPSDKGPLLEAVPCHPT